jgi:hypothetical protein
MWRLLLRTMLYEAAFTAYSSGSRWSWLNAWGSGWPSGAVCVEPSSRSPGAWPWFCTRCGLTVVRSAGASPAPQFLRLLEPAQEKSRAKR